jgi:YkoY family integral membrane protein
MSSFLLHTTGTILALALLEAVLSADNAVAIAALVQDLEPAELRSKALNWGLVAALVLRVLVIIFATWVVRYSQVQLLGGLYLLWLALRHVQEQFRADDPASAPNRRELNLSSLIAVIALTDLAFSLDSVTAAIAVTDRVWLVVLGGAMGIAMLRLLAGWVLVWMQKFENLQNAAYLIVMAVGLRLIAKVWAPQLCPSEPILLLTILIFFVWGFSRVTPLPTVDGIKVPAEPIQPPSGSPARIPVSG